MASSHFDSSGPLLGSLLALALLAGCDNPTFEQDYIVPGPSSRDAPRYSSEEQPQTIFGEGSLNLLGFLSEDRQTSGAGAGIGVNSFLWRASLDTISFMPLSSADPFGGVIITDWYTPPEAPAERFKMNVYILGRELRADGVRVAVFRQEKNAAGQWADAGIGADTSTNLENRILTRARQLRVASASTR